MKYTKLHNLRIRTKLLMLTVMICLAFIVIVYITTASFSKVSDMSTGIVDSGLEKVIVNADTMRKLSNIFAEIDLLEHTFYKNKDYLKSEGTRLSGILKSITESTTDPDLKRSLLTLSGNFESFLSQSDDVNAASHNVETISRRIYSNLSELESMVGKLMIDLTLEEKDTAFAEQQMMLLIGFRENLLNTDKLFSENEHIHYIPPSDTKAPPVIIAIDDLILRFRAFPSFSPGETTYSDDLYNDGIAYKEAVHKYNKTIEQHNLRLKDLADSRGTLISKMQVIDHEISKTSRTLNIKIEETIVSSGNIVLIVSIAVVTMLGLNVFFLIRSNINDPMKSILKGIEGFRKGDLDTQIALKRNDEWNTIGNSFNDMAHEFKTMIEALKNSEQEVRAHRDNLEELVKERTAKLLNTNEELGIEIIEREKVEGELIRSRREWEDTFDIMTDAITIHDKDFNIVKANMSAMKILDLPILKGNKIKCHKYYHGTDDPPERCPSCTCVKTGKSVTFEVFEPHLNKYLEIRALPRFDSKNQISGVIHLVRDISEKHALEEKLKSMSITDDLTALYNRRGFFTLIEQQLKTLKREKEKAFMLYFDIDNFKMINDTLGHSTGDSVLINTAVILRSTFRESDIIARIGGDEFVVFPAGKNEADINIVIERLQSNIDVYNQQEKRGYKLSMSVGTAVYDPEYPRPIDDVMAEADRSMYANKREKKNS